MSALPCQGIIQEDETMATKKYSMLQIGLHWWIAILFAINYIISDGMGRFLHQHLDGQDLSNEFTVTVHTYVGLAFLAFVAIRVLVRIFKGAPAVIPTSNPKLDKLAVAVHHILYLLMVLVPLAGIAAWYGGFEIFGDIHVVIMNIMLGLIGLHAVAALYHRFILKDGVMNRMSFLQRH